MAPDKMKKWGATLLVLGVGSFVLPLLGMQFRILNLTGASQPFGAVVMIAVGGGLLAVARSRERAPTVKAAAGATPSVPAARPPAPVEARPAGPRCTACGQPIARDDTFCSECGAPVQPVQTAPAVARCRNPACAAVLTPGRKFCTQCGTKVA